MIVIPSIHAWHTALYEYAFFAITPLQTFEFIVTVKQIAEEELWWGKVQLDQVFVDVSFLWSKSGGQE